MTFSAAQAQHTSIPSQGGRLVTTDGRSLPLRGTSIRAEAAGGIARVVLEQRFVNPHDEPLRLTYLVPLPEDSAVSGYAFRLGERSIVGRVEPLRAARERFEQALLEGRTAGLLEEERGSLFTQELGNVPPRAEIVCVLTIDQRLTWLDEGAWEWRFPTVVAPRYLGEPGRTPDADKLLVDVADRPIAAKVTTVLTIGDAMIDAPSSPSHALTLREAGAIDLGPAALDRDLVVRWPVARPQVGLTLSTCRPAGDQASSRAGYGLVTIVPPASGTKLASVGRDLCLLLDTSGSMDGAPLAQAQRVAIALVDSLGDGDRLEMIEFGDEARRWRPGMVAADARSKAAAIAWLRALRASGGTDMTAGILEALANLRSDAQRQVVLVTDGQIGFESEVLRQIVARLPATSRLHTVGVGEAVNRSLTRPASRAGGGVEVIIGIDEDPERACARILRRTARPLLTDLSLSGSALLALAPTRSADLFAGCPGLVSVSLRPEGGELVVRGRGAGGAYEERVSVPPLTAGSGSAALAALYAREHVADLELEQAAGGASEALDAAIEAAGLAFQIATRRTAFVAVSDERTVDPTAPTRSEVMPHVLPHGMSAVGLGLRAAAPVVMASMMSKLVAHDEALAELAAPAPTMRSAPKAPASLGGTGGPRGGEKQRKGGGGLLQRVRRLVAGEPLQEEGASTAGPRARRLRGMILQRGGGRCIVAIEIDALFELPELAEIRGFDRAGRERRITVDPATSTRPGPTFPGQVARVVLLCADEDELVRLVLGEEEDAPVIELEETR